MAEEGIVPADDVDSAGGPNGFANNMIAEFPDELRHDVFGVTPEQEAAFEAGTFDDAAAEARFEWIRTDGEASSIRMPSMVMNLMTLHDAVEFSGASLEAASRMAYSLYMSKKAEQGDVTQ